MSNSVKTANDIRVYVNELIEGLYKTDEGIELLKKRDLLATLEEVRRLSQENVINTVSDAIVIESLY